MSVRSLVFVLPAVLLLSGCVSLFDGMWEDAAREQCDRESPSQRGACHDSVDREMRERDRD